MKISIRLVIRQMIKCVFWPITIPLFLVFSLAVPPVASMRWAWGNDDDPSLWVILKRETCYYIKDVGTLIVG